MAILNGLNRLIVPVGSRLLRAESNTLATIPHIDRQNYPPLGLSLNRVTAIFALGMRDFLAGIGLAFLVATSFSLLGGYRDNQKKHVEPTWEGAFRALGLGAFVVWFIVGLGLISWLVVLTFGLFAR